MTVCVSGMIIVLNSDAAWLLGPPESQTPAGPAEMLVGLPAPEISMVDLASRSKMQQMR